VRGKGWEREGREKEGRGGRRERKGELAPRLRWIDAPDLTGGVNLAYTCSADSARSSNILFALRHAPQK